MSYRASGGNAHTPPRSAALCATSQFLGVERCRAARGVVSQGLSRELAQRILRGRELVAPVLLVPELFEEPVSDAILFFGRQRRKFGNGRIERSGHDVSIPNVGGAAQQRLHLTAAVRARLIRSVQCGRRG